MSRKTPYSGRVHIPIDDISMKDIENDMRELQSYNTRPRSPQRSEFTGSSPDSQTSDGQSRDMSGHRPATRHSSVTNGHFPDLDFARAKTNIENIKNELLKEAAKETSVANPRRPLDNHRAQKKVFLSNQLEASSESRQPQELALDRTYPEPFYFQKKPHHVHTNHRKGPEYFPDLEVPREIPQDQFLKQSQTTGGVNPHDKIHFQKAMAYLGGNNPTESVASGRKTEERSHPSPYRDARRNEIKGKEPEPANRKNYLENDKEFAEALAFLKTQNQYEDKFPAGYETVENAITPGVSDTDDHTSRGSYLEKDKTAVKSNVWSRLQEPMTEDRNPVTVHKIKSKIKKTKNGTRAFGKARKKMMPKTEYKMAGKAHRKHSKAYKDMEFETVKSNDTYFPLAPEMIARERSRDHQNHNATLILDEGVDKVEVPITGTSTWHKLIHGRRDIVLGGSVVAGVGLLIIIFSIIYMLINKRKRLAVNKNNSKLYRRLGTTDERARIKQHGHSLFDVSTDDNDESSDEDTVYNYPMKGSY